MDEYVLCSSSTEQGEIPFISVKRPRTDSPYFPRNKSQLQHLYLPGTSLFIGSNSIPRSCDYQSDTLTTKLKKRIKQDLPYPFHCISLDSDKAFFADRFAIDSELEPLDDVSLDFVDVRESLAHIKEPYRETIRRETTLQHIKEPKDDGYGELCQNIAAGDHNEVTQVVIRDSMLNSLKNNEAFTHFVVTKKNKTLCAVFDKTYFRVIGYYEYLSRYGEEVIRSLDSSEVRTYSNKDIFLTVYSSTTFHDHSGVQRLFSGVDVNRSVDVAVCLENVKIVEHPGSLSNELNILLGIPFREGEYVLNDRKIYKIDPDGERFAYVGFSFSGFMSDEEQTQDS